MGICLTDLNMQVKAAAAGWWPTPTACQGNNNSAMNSGSAARRMLRRNTSEAEAKQMETGALNPTWVEWLMGFPLGWTDLELSETPSSRKSPS